MPAKPSIAPTMMKTVPSGREEVCMNGASAVGGTDGGTILYTPEIEGRTPPVMPLSPEVDEPVMVGTAELGVVLVSVSVGFASVDLVSVLVSVFVSVGFASVAFASVLVSVSVGFASVVESVFWASSVGLASSVVFASVAAAAAAPVAVSFAEVASFEAAAAAAMLAASGKFVSSAAEVDMASRQIANTAQSQGLRRTLILYIYARE